MTTTLQLQRNTIADNIDQLINRIANPGNAQKRSIADAVRQRTAENFTRQGSGSGQWAQLAPRTIIDRQRKGYAGSRPILVRDGGFRDSHINRGSAMHYESIVSSAGGFVVETGSNDFRDTWLQRGTRRMPARHVNDLDDTQERRIVDVIDLMVYQIESNLR